jgi:hypothetical protein
VKRYFLIVRGSGKPKNEVKQRHAVRGVLAELLILQILENLPDFLTMGLLAKTQ